MGVLAIAVDRGNAIGFEEDRFPGIDGRSKPCRRPLSQPTEELAFDIVPDGAAIGRVCGTGNAQGLLEFQALGLPSPTQCLGLRGNDTAQVVQKVGRIGEIFETGRAPMSRVTRALNYTQQRGLDHVGGLRRPQAKPPQPAAGKQAKMMELLCSQFLQSLEGPFRNCCVDHSHSVWPQSHTALGHDVV